MQVISLGMFHLVPTTSGYVARNIFAMPVRIKGKGQRRPTRIRDWREYRGYTQDEMAELMGASKASVSRVETGDQPYTQDFLELAADILKTEPEFLLATDPHKHKRKRQNAPEGPNR